MNTATVVPIALLLMALLLPTAAADEIQLTVLNFSSLNRLDTTVSLTFTGGNATETRMSADSDGDGTVSSSEADALENQYEFVIAPSFTESASNLKLDGDVPDNAEYTGMTMDGLEGAVLSSDAVVLTASGYYEYVSPNAGDDHTFVSHTEAGDEGGTDGSFMPPPGYVVTSVTGLDQAKCTGTGVSGKDKPNTDVVIAFSKGSKCSLSKKSDGGDSPGASALVALTAGLVAFLATRRRE